MTEGTNEKVEQFNSRDGVVIGLPEAPPEPPVKTGAVPGGGGGPVPPPEGPREVPALSNRSVERINEEKLATAVPVEDLPPELVHDVELKEVKKKQAFYLDRRFLRGAGLICLTVAVAVIVVVVVILKKNQNNEPDPTPFPSSAPTMGRELAVRQELASYLGEEAFMEEKTPYALALEWILYDDPLALDEFSPTLLQRYVLALFWFQTSQKKDWISCNPPDDKASTNTTCEYFLFSRARDNTPIFTPQEELLTRWLTGTHECNWAQVECSSTDSVRGLQLIGQNLTGSLPVELRFLTHLQSLSLNSNQLTGSIPTEYGEMESLVLLEFSDNRLNGSIPDNLFRHSNLLHFNPSFNLITGTIPTQVGSMSGLHHLFLFETLMMGTVPSELGQLDLRTLWLYSNSLTGTLPSEIGKMSLMTDLRLSYNHFSGSLPSEIGNCKQLQNLWFAAAMMNNSTIPESFWQLTNLQTIDFGNSGFGGTISTSVGNLPYLYGLKLERNNLVGTVPTELGQIDNLQLLWVHINELSGSIPMDVCALRGPSSLSFLNADCALVNGTSQVSCQCCTGCCDPNGICQKV